MAPFSQTSSKTRSLGCTDDHWRQMQSLVAAIVEVFPQGQYQLCMVYFMRNILSQVSRVRAKEVYAMLKAIFTQKNRPSVCVKRSKKQIIHNLTWIFEVPQLGDQDRIFPPGQNLIDGGKLAGQTDRLPHIVGHCRNVKTIDGGGTADLFEQCGEDSDNCCLARSVGAEHSKNTAFPHLEIYALQYSRGLERFFMFFS